MKTIIYLLLSLALFSCYASKKINRNWGCVKICPKYIDSTSQQFVYMPYYGPEYRIWYKDSLIIEEAIGLNMATINNGPERRWLTQEPYIFIDLKKDYYYKYSSFSDTARLVGKMEKYDTLKFGVPWDFYIRKGDLYRTDLEVLTDTIIDGIVFKRMCKKIPYTTEGKNNVARQIIYLRCDKKNTVIQLDSRMMEKFGCPAVRAEVGSYSLEIKFIKDGLTAEEKKIFDAWEKNAKKNPVIKP